jgi:hypothetical protein
LIAFETLVGFSLVLLCMGLILLFALIRQRSRSQAGRGKPRAHIGLRPIAAMSELQRAMGLAVEEGARLHVSLGKSSLVAPSAGSALVGLSTLERVAQMSSVSDRPPIATSGDGALSLLSQDTLQASYRIAHAPELFDPDRARLTGITPLSYVAGTLPIIRDEHVSANVLVGNFGPEAVLMVDAGDQRGAFTLAAADTLPTQAALYAAAKAPLIGEEVFAIPAYLQGGSTHYASLRAQDVLRWIIILGLIAGAALKLLGISL